MYCKNCGQALMDGARFCTGCGAPVVPDFAPVEEDYPVEIISEESLPHEEYVPAEYTSEYMEEEYAPAEYAGEYVEEEYAPAEYAGEYVEEEYAPAEYAEEIPVEEVSVEEVPVEEVPVEEVPVEEIPVEEVPVEEVPVGEIPVEEVPVEEVPVEEIPVEEVPVDEIPVEEVPVAEIPMDDEPTILLPEENTVEAPVAALCSNCGTPLEDGMAFCTECGTPVAAAAPVATEEIPVIPAVSGKKPKAEKAPGEKKRLSKKAVIWIVVAAVVVLGAAGGFLGWYFYQMSSTYDAAFAALDNRDYDEALALFEKYDYKDSEIMADMLRTQQADYDSALHALDTHDYETARNIFEYLGDYRDSAEWSQYRVTYEQATFVMACAMNGDFEAGCNALGETDTAAASENFAIAYLYYNAGDLFSSVYEYQDSGYLADDCYFNAGIYYLEEESWNNADNMLNSIVNEDTARTFEETYQSYCADGEALALIEASLNLYNLYPEMDATYIAGLDENIAALEALASEHFYNDNLMTVVDMFCFGLSQERESMDEEGYMLDEVLFYEGCATQSDAIDMLIELGFGFSDESLMDSYIGFGDYYRACAVISQDLHDQLNGQTAEYDDEVGDYLTYTNNTGNTFILGYHFEFSAEGEYLGSSDQYQLEVPNGETVKIPLNIPNDIAYIWDEWTIWRDFEITDY